MKPPSAPRAPLTLVTPGPVEIPPIVQRYLVDPPCNYHRQDGFKAMFDANQASLKRLVGLAEPDAWFVTILLASGTGTNEACLRALAGLGPGVIVRNGFFGQRLVDQAVRTGIAPVVFDAPHDRPVDVAALDELLAAHPGLRWAYVVSHETRATLRNPLEAIGRTCKRRGLIVAADCVSSAFAYPLDLEGGAIDLAVATTSKALMAVPGLGLVFARHAVMAALREAAGAAYYLDVVAEYVKQRAERAPRFGQPVQLHAAVRGACLHLEAVGIDAHMRRIRRQLDAVTAHLEDRGCRALLDPRHRGGVAANFVLPPGLDYPELAARMADEGYYVLYGAIEDPSQFQICTMGHLDDDDIAGLCRALGRVLRARRQAVA